MMRTLAIPEVAVEVAGTPLSADDLRWLTGVRVQQRLSLPTMCELAFCAAPDDLPPSLTRRLVPGTALRVTVRGQSVPLFEGEITALEHVYGPASEQEVHVRGYDLLHRLRKRQQVRAHVQVTVEDLVRDLAADAGLSVQAAASGPLWDILVQHRQSDLELLQEATERCGLYMSVRQDTLHLMPLSGVGEAVPLALGETLLEARVEVNGDPACREVHAVGWNPSRVETHEGNASSARVGRTVRAEVSPDDVGGDGTRELVDEAAESDDHAEGMAQAELDLRAAREVTLWGVAEGDPRLRPGTPVDVSGLAAELSGRYVLTSVTHTADTRMGFVSEISTEPPVPKQRRRGVVVTPGKVTRVDDPDGLGRVRVELPTYGGVESAWMGVLSAGAGSNKGLVIMPDAGDQVLVLFSHEDPGQGIVLGGLYGVQGPPDAGVEGGGVKRYTVLTPGGLRVKLDDEHDTIRLENHAGSYVQLAPDKVLLRSATDMEIAAPGKQVMIRANFVDFERA